MKRNFLIGLVFLMAFAATSCNKDFERVIADKDYSDTLSIAYGNPKVLYIIVDGARGTSVRDAAIPNIKSLLPTAIYSWTALANPDFPNEASNWADMLTGVKENKHNVQDQTFSNNQLQKFPVIYKRIKEEKPTIDPISLSSSPVFDANLTEGTTEHKLFADDNEVKNAVVNKLAIDSTEFIVANFTDVDKAGEQYGYDNSFPEYKTAIENFDKQVGDILTALKARPHYKNENWLIIVASSTGGAFTLPATQNDNTVFSDTKVNTFSIYSAPKLTQRVLTKPYTGNRFTGTTIRLFDRESGVHAIIPPNVSTEEFYNFPDTIGFTIELKVKKNDPRGDGSYRQNYPTIFGKMNEWSSNHPLANEKGWCFFLEEDFWQFYVRGDNGDRRFQQRGQVLGKGTWNQLTAKVEIRNGKRFLRTYTDGVYYGEHEVTDFGNFTTSAPLTLGFIPGNGHGQCDVQIADVRIWRTALPDNVIKNYSCETSVDETHPYYNYLAGYWPVLDGSGSKIKDYSTLENDFDIQGNYAWTNFNGLVCSPSSAELASMVPQNADIPAQILSWLHIPRKAIWQIDGRVWLDQ
jgi:hypothetical protein